LLNHLQKSLLRTALLSLLLPLFALEVSASPLETIQTKIGKYLKRPGVRSAFWGIQILDPDTNSVLLEVNPDKAFLPASVLKMVTTSAALEKLGPEFKFRTGVYTNGTIEPDGTIAGDLILVGRGDPNLTDPYGELFEKPALQELAESIKNLGIKRIKGDIIGDDSYFDSNSPVKGWTAQALKSLYGAPINALNVNNNVLWVHARPTKRNERVSIELEPRTSYFNIRNLTKTGGRRVRSTISVRLIRGTNTIVVSGTLPSTKTSSQHILLEKSPEVAAAMLRDALKKLDIETDGKISAIHCGYISDEEQKTWKLLAEHQSPPLIRALEIINKKSQNLHAEMLLRTLGAEFKGAGTNEAGLQVVKEFLVNAGIDSEKIRLSDGCGLSRENLITPRFQTSLLQFLSQRYYFDLFRNSLAISGTDGTLKNRLAATEVRGSIHAKTGTLNGVTTLAGYMTTKSGRNLVFTILANRARASERVKKTIDEICSLFVNLY
jgi:D-alanyl-D-alanine carboxypeptidase/D-alanyl-D-alanine-endopeptidase (penicillin-binding protein 4)